MSDFTQKQHIVRGYVSAPSKPPFFDLEVTAITHGHGRVVWGCDVRTFRNGDPLAIKYPKSRYGLDRWIFEVLNPAFCTLDEWEAARYKYFEGAGTIDMYGPYPSDGIWGMKMLLQTFPECDYLPCCEDFLLWLRMNHQAWESAPMAAYASLEAYNRMMEEMAREKVETQAEVDKAVDEHVAYCRTHADEINASDTRETFLITPDGQPWRREQVNA